MMCNLAPLFVLKSVGIVGVSCGGCESGRVEIPEMQHRNVILGSEGPKMRELLAFGRAPPPQAEDYRYPGLQSILCSTECAWQKGANQRSRDNSRARIFGLSPSVSWRSCSSSPGFVPIWGRRHVPARNNWTRAAYQTTSQCHQASSGKMTPKRWCCSTCRGQLKKPRSRPAS